MDIIDQWNFIRNVVVEIGESIQATWYRLVTRAAIAGNGQTGCERINYDCNLATEKLSTAMQIPMISARHRVKANGPPLYKIDPKEARNLWISQGHQYASAVTEQKLVLDRIRKADATKLDSKIFNCF